VIGTGEATIHFAAQLGRRIGLVSIDQVFEVWHYEQAERYGLRERVVAVGGLGAIPEDFGAAFAGDEEAFIRLRAAFIACARPLVERVLTSSCRPACCRVCSWPASAASSSTVRRSSIAPRWRSRPPRWGSACTD
jgi:hypothetical protein